MQSITQTPSLNLAELETLLQDLLSRRIALSERTYIFIDALDECDMRERKIVFNVLRSAIASSQSKLKVFLTSRDSIGDEVKRLHFPLQHQSMGSPNALSSMTEYIGAALATRVEEGELIVGDGKLVDEIRDALVGGAQGM